MIGRTAELEAVERFLGDLEQAPGALLLEGSPGIGKTTVWRRVLERARARGMVVLACRPVEAEVKQSFASLADLLEPVVDDVLPDLPEPQREALAVALLRAGAAGTAPSPRAVAAAVLSTLRELAAGTPVVLAIDDLHWLDRASADALAFAVRRVGAHRIGVAAALRSEVVERPDPLALDDAFAGRVTRVRVGPLSLSALHHVIRLHLAHVFTRPTLRRIADTSGGNPFFALELGRALLDAGASLAPGEPLPVPDGMTSLVLHRLERLPVRVRRALLFVAAASSPTLTLLRRALGSRDADAALGRALPARLLDVAGASLRSAHPLIATTVYASAAPEERRDVHRKLAAIVDSPEERARHLALATQDPDEAVARALDGAAELARRRGATDVAAELQEQAVGLTPPGDREAVRRRQTAAAELFFHAGERARARTLLDGVLAQEIAVSIRVRALHLLGKIHGQEDGFVAAIPHFEAALRLGPEPSVKVAIEMDLVLAIFSTGDLPRAAGIAREALVEAERLGDASLIAEALAVSVTGDAAVGRGVDWTSVERALALEDRSRAVQTILRPTALAGQLAALEGRFGWTCTAYRELCRWATERGEESELPFLLVGLARAECWRGNFATAIADADEAVLICTQTANESMHAVALAHRAAARALLGDVAGARADLALSKPLGERTGYVQATMWSLATETELELSRGDAAAAARACAPLVALVEATGVAEPFVVHFVPDAVEALIGVGELDRAEALLDPFTTRASELGRRWALAGATRSRALLAAARGALDEAAATAEDAVERWGEQEIPCDLGRALLVLGRVRRRRGERRAARDALARARDVFAARGARLWVERASEELGRIPIRRAASPDLTATEARVAALAARGRTNREVAQALFMSPKTVQANLTRIYAKLGIRTRAELGARFAERAAGTNESS